MADVVTLTVATDWLRRFAAKVCAQQEQLTELDAAIGDGDHGINMARGTREMLATLDEASSIDGLLKQAGLRLVSNVGGTSGPLYGTFLMKLGMALHSAEARTTEVASALRAGLDALIARGKAQPGDKTMVDALAPAVEAFEHAVQAGQSLSEAARAAQVAAAAGRDATEGMLARKGRASYLGERSVGHLDPGAVSAAYLLDAFAEAVA